MPVLLSKEQREEIGDIAVKAVKAIGYEGLGTLEFLLENNNFYFMEMNTRLQVEHPVTEMTTGIDLVKEQINISAGGKLEIDQEKIRINGHAIECRINAEDSKTFVPSPGKIKQFHQPGGLGVRFDSALYQGYVVPAHYDSMIAKIITHGKDRNESIARMKRALEECIIIGINNTIQLHQDILTKEEFISGRYNINFMKSVN